MNQQERVNKIRSILNDKFSKFKMVVSAENVSHKWDIHCGWNLVSGIFLAPKEIIESIIRDRILDMLKESKELIEHDIEELEQTVDVEAMKV